MKERSEEVDESGIMQTTKYTQERKDIGEH
jgi:hypothetical protein